MIFATAIFLCLIAILYSTVGHGGASGYIAVLSLVGYPLSLIKPDALILNVFVSGIAFFQFYRAGYFQFRKFLPLILGSVPLAWFGGTITLPGNWYKIILGILLIIPAIWFLVQLKYEDTPKKKMHWTKASGIGAILGFISGLTGIGGGVFLSPILLLGKWESQKSTAALSAPFIFVNSLAGLIGSFQKNPTLDSNIPILAAACVTGGIVGSMLGAWKLNPQRLKTVLSLVLFIASFKLIVG